jgi:hypothetical protein
MFYIKDFLFDLGLYYKTFYGRNLHIFVISYNDCPFKAFPD